MRRAVALAAIGLLAACGGGEDDDAQPAATTTTTSTVDATTTTTTTATTTGETAAEHYPDHVGELYAGTDNWICHPELAESVCTDIRTTVLAADGTQTVDDLAPATDPGFDCFYLYPTTSTDPGTNSDLEVDSSETHTVMTQVARYGSVCRLFAPAYRQITLAGLFADRSEGSGEMAYADVLDAWSTYVDELGDGRGVVLVGHSQGASLLNRLIREEIAPSPEQRSLLISAVLLGSAFVEGSVPNVDTCASADEVGCVITYASFPADSPPGEDSFFGRDRDGGGPAACVDPVALAGGSGLADAVLPATGGLFPGADVPGVTTPFVAYPAALRTECVATAERGYLAVSTTGQEDARILDVFFRQLPDPSWGTHVVDASLAQDDLIEIVNRQAEAYAAAG